MNTDSTAVCVPEDLICRGKDGFRVYYLEAGGGIILDYIPQGFRYATLEEVRVAGVPNDSKGGILVHLWGLFYWVKSNGAGIELEQVNEPTDPLRGDKRVLLATAKYPEY